MIVSIKKIVTIVCLFCVWSTFPAYSSDTLTGSEERALLLGIEDMCWDIWCEGGYRFNFHSFECDFSNEECWFEYEYISWRGVEESFEAECLISAGSTEDLFANEESFEISSYLYGQVSNCIDESSGEVYDHYKKLYDESDF